MIIVMRPGMLDLVVDLGRPGYRNQGVPEGGAADTPALIHANRLVGNPDSMAGLELTLRGPELLFPEGGVIALTGADMDARVNGGRLQYGVAQELEPGAKLEIGMARSGARGYLAMAGGLDVPVVLGSRSVFLPGGWGGWQGRALRSGDRLPVGREGGQAEWLRMPEFTPCPDCCLRVLPGPQLGSFSDKALVSFLEQVYTVDADSNRVGIRLQGVSLEYQGEELASQGVLPGAVQVPPGGQPIILGWDGPVTGGYPVIAGVISTDLPRLAQLKPGDRVSFRMVGVEQARMAWRRAATWLS
jgi:biotin-dependent carboxylase-like uncharacterized protein